MRRRNDTSRDRTGRVTRPLTALLLALALAACGGEEPAATDGSSSVQIAGDALCQAESFAAQGDLTGAKDAFLDAHQALHDAAASLEERDRTLAAQLLQAKQTVEEALATPTEGEVLASRLAQLRGAFEAGAALMGTPVTGCAV